ncbi:hypothetical protein [Paucisalibacillus globulus]|uniref:hypothetical protein n=1 Tax=Paucisalibacillus globulus TaxID=351095 RepID=UPI000BB72F8D|nr:hypothetical protein [Paucisalibacillus globulus]
MQITKDDVTQFPCFFNHQSARMWLKSVYGEYIALSHVDYRMETKIYFYHLVQDKTRYLEWKDSKMRLEPVEDSVYRDTYQLIEITETGRLKLR